jgi:hypothetical protein
VVPIFRQSQQQTFSVPVRYSGADWIISLMRKIPVLWWGDWPPLSQQPLPACMAAHGAAMARIFLARWLICCLHKAAQLTGFMPGVRMKCLDEGGSASLLDTRKMPGIVMSREENQSYKRRPL